MRGVTQDVVLPFTLVITDGIAVMDATLALDRSAYKVGIGMWAGDDWVGHQVDVKIHLTASPK